MSYVSVWTESNSWQSDEQGTVTLKVKVLPGKPIKLKQLKADATAELIKGLDNIFGFADDEEEEKETPKCETAADERINSRLLQMERSIKVNIERLATEMSRLRERVNSGEYITRAELAKAQEDIKAIKEREKAPEYIRMTAKFALMNTRMDSLVTAVTAAGERNTKVMEAIKVRDRLCDDMAEHLDEVRASKMEMHCMNNAIKTLQDAVVEDRCALREKIESLKDHVEYTDTAGDDIWTVITQRLDDMQKEISKLKAAGEEEMTLSERLDAVEREVKELRGKVKVLTDERRERAIRTARKIQQDEEFDRWEERAMNPND